MPAIWRALTDAGSLAITRNTIQLRRDATIAAPSTPSLASSSRWPVNACVEISSETVKPMPATAPPPTIVGQLSDRRRPLSQGRDASQVAVTMPIGLPIT